MNNLPILSVSDLGHCFFTGDQYLEVLRNVSFDLYQSELVVLSGPSGCGKTTLLTLIAGLRTVQSGSIKLFGEELCDSNESKRNQLRSLIGMIFQSHRLISFLTAEENVMVSMDGLSTKVQPFSLKKERARDLLSKLGLADKFNVFPSALSGGQRQRVAIARALACNPKFLIADEPTASLDGDNSRFIMDLLHQLVVDNDLTILMTSHDQRLLHYADRVMKIDDGKLYP